MSATVFRGHQSMNLIIDYHHRSQPARSRQGDRFKRKKHIWRGIVYWIDSKPVLQRFQNSSGLFDMAGSSITNSYEVLAFGFQGKVRIKRCHSKHFCGGSPIEIPINVSTLQEGTGIPPEPPAGSVSVWRIIVVLLKAFAYLLKFTSHIIHKGFLRCV